MKFNHNLLYILYKKITKTQKTLATAGHYAFFVFKTHGQPCLGILNEKKDFQNANLILTYMNIIVFILGILNI